LQAFPEAKGIGKIQNIESEFKNTEINPIIPGMEAAARRFSSPYAPFRRWLSCFPKIYVIILGMKKAWPLLLIACCSLFPLRAQEEIEAHIQKKEWPALAALFADNSHQALVDYFADCQSVGFTRLQPGTLMFFVRFSDFAEIGEISYIRENGAYRQLELKRTIKPLYFVRDFSRYAVSDRRLRMGDAEVILKKGVLYRGRPMGTLFLFSGEWEFRIQPSSQEEQLTLRALERSDTLVHEGRAGLFIISRPEELLQGLDAPEPSAGPGDEESLALYKRLQDHWGIPITHFNDLWYFPFTSEFNAAFFQRRPGKSYFRYIYNSGIAPDTSLVLVPDNKYYLSYNAVKGLKFSSRSIDELSELKLNMFFNPDEGFLSATSVLNFKEPSNLKTVNLAAGLEVKGFGKSRQQDLQLFRRDDTCYLLGDSLDKFSFFYSGAIAADSEGREQAKVVVRNRDRGSKGVDAYYFLDRDQNFYPNPGQHFFKSQLKVSLPESMLCLASGRLRSKQKLGERNEFVFESPGSKGLSLVCGGFAELMTVAAALPVHVYGNPKLRLRPWFSAETIREYVDFLADKYGPLAVPELHLLLRRWRDYGGWSNQGFVVFNFRDISGIEEDMSVTRRLRNTSPVVFTDVNRDSLLHELAHQWWGGMVSWRTYQDQWLTEGLAQFSTLLYLQSTVSESQFRRVLAGVRRTLFKRNDAGPIIYGRRIANLSNDLHTYQSIVYNKSALVFLMLKEMLGEEELLRRLRQLLDDFRFQSLTSSRFIQEFSRGDARLLKFFAGWIHTRPIPDVTYRVAIGGAGAEVSFSQRETDFVFPVGVRVVTGEGTSRRTLIVESKQQTFKILENSPVLSVEVDPLVSPIDLHD
jgi:hypothetical protein